MRYREILIESTPKTMYHGTLKKHLPSIMALGLKPTVGAFVRWAYKEYEDEGMELDDLVFAADKAGLHKCINAIFHHLETEGLPETLGSFYEYGAIVVMSRGESRFENADDEDQEHPTSVEPEDYYRRTRIKPDYFLTDKRLRNFLRRNALVNYRSVFDRKTVEAELIRLLKAEFPEDSLEEFRKKLADLSNAQLQELTKQMRGADPDSDM